ncbi:tRNA (adenosine(37)-N6)-threonylcarbamoyltransferase complex ATPase subunit type 1 TsaE [Lacihabitans soyangensis]|uniref:tRNA threonylcarbamoyladenosine biosynthesis protein TsaE n=2 Tax=Lacihabitans soyangensis TaxID=869394 RepID=A0AAE3H5L2_9BACT|nr:tRNA (adenosine(37)-N6)-threonylcarbamoyltransferase complex ATPase subunit type 1 TsaE [Lacihabitans soyangensis]
MSAVADEIIRIGSKIPIWTFEGNLGAGKTTLIKILAKKLGIIDPISSPTFSYVNEYDHKIFHFDCYRLQSVEEALDFGLEEYLDSGKMCWVEWPQIIESIIPLPKLEIVIEHAQNFSRNISVKTIN